jgi:hypothetical protein
LKRAEDLHTFLSLKKAIDENLEFMKDKNRSWEYVKERFRSKDFEKVKEVKSIKELEEGAYE